MRRKLVVGNWKMHGSLAQNKALMGSLIEGLKGMTTADFALCVPNPYLFQAQTLLADTNILWGAQNVSPYEQGAFTACISASMVADFGCTFVIIGHSERRALNHESNKSAANRLIRAVNAGLTPIFCVGETLEEREAGQAETVVINQMESIICGLENDVFNRAKQLNTVISYEPVWAIGTGRVATPQQAQDMHSLIRNYIAKRDAEFAAKVRILYGGSLTPENACAILTMPDIDGGLVGRCSLVAEDFRRICMVACDTTQCFI